MNEQNWQLAQDRPDLYIPNKLPFFKPGDDNALEEQNDAIKLIRLHRAQSHYSTHQEQDSEVKDLLLDDQNTISFPSQEAILLQLPGTLPFADIKPHTG